MTSPTAQTTDARTITISACVAARPLVTAIMIAEGATAQTATATPETNVLPIRLQSCGIARKSAKQ